MTGHDARRGAEELRAELTGWAATRTWAEPFPEVLTALTRAGRADLSLGRLVEGHADAQRILAEAGLPPRPGLYGVWASRSVGTGLRAEREGVGWRLRGELRFASGVDVIDQALTPGWVDDETHLLFDLPAASVVPDRDSWHTAAMAAARSYTVAVDVVVETPPVGGPDFYLSRPGFAVGGLGVAAVWAGGAQLLTDLVAAGLQRFRPTAHQLRRLGVMEQACWQAEAAVAFVADRLTTSSDEAVAAAVSSARSAVVSACASVLDHAATIVGPAGLSTNAALAQGIADLQIYVRQHHVDLVLEALGRRRLEGGRDVR